MQMINLKIAGIPYGKRKVFGNKDGLKQWTGEIKKQTQGLPKIKEACLMKVTFLLPMDKFPKNFPFGSDLDNLLKRFCDALNETVFSEAKGKDSCIVSLYATKSKVEDNKEAGALLEILPINIT